MRAVVAAVTLLATLGLARGAVGATARSRVRRRLPGCGPWWGLGPPLSLPGPPAPVRGWLDRAEIGVDPAVAWTAWLAAAGAIGAASLVLGGVALAAVAVVGAAVGPALVLRSRRRRSEVRVEVELPAALEAVARALRSGASLHGALDEAPAQCRGPLAAELERMARAARGGQPLQRALAALAVRRPLPGVRLAVAALSVAIETGAAHARAVDGVAATLRERLAVAAEVRAQSAQARLSAVVIGLAPVVFGAFALAADPRVGDLLLRTPLGVAILAAGLGLDAAGWWWMQRLVRSGR